MFAQCQAVSVGNYQFLIFCQIHSSEEISHHGESLGVSNNCCLRICFHEILNIGCMVRFHMLYYQIIRFGTIQNFGDISQPFFCKINIYSIHDCDLFVHDHIRVVRHTVWHYILSFKQIHLMVINAYIINIISDFHCNTYLLIGLSKIYFSFFISSFSLLCLLYPLFSIKAIGMCCILDIFCQVYVLLLFYRYLLVCFAFPDTFIL